MCVIFKFLGMFNENKKNPAYNKGKKKRRNENTRKKMKTKIRIVMFK